MGDILRHSLIFFTKVGRPAYWFVADKFINNLRTIFQTILAILSCLFLYYFWARFEHSLALWLIVSPAPPQFLQEGESTLLQTYIYIYIYNKICSNLNFFMTSLFLLLVLVQNISVLQLVSSNQIFSSRARSFLCLC